MKSKYKKQILSGVFTGLFVWIVLTIADAVDELILDEDYFIGAIVFVASPIIMFVSYIIHYNRYKPERKELFVWFASYFVAFSLLWLTIYYLLCDNNYIIKQKCRTEGIDLNRMEYICYGYSALIGFIVFCIIFHCAHIFKNICKKKHGEN